jgi:hypothetical protein
MDDLIQAASTTALDDPLRPPRPNHLLQGVLAFLAVVGIGSALTLVLRPPVQLRVITVEKRVPFAVPTAPALAPGMLPPTVTQPAPHRKLEPPRRPQLAQLPKPPSKPLPSSADCKDPLCGLGDLKQ